MTNTYQRWVDELGEEGAKAKMREIGSLGGKRGGGKAGFQSLTKRKRQAVARKGGKASARNKAMPSL